MIEVAAAGLSTSGQVRDENEDAHVIVCPEDPVVRERRGYLTAIADGLGGQNAGQVASATALRALVDAYYAPTAASRVEPALQHATQVANLRVHDASRANADFRGMQTTLSALVLAGTAAYVAHVGDSRVYHWRRGVLTAVTTDHSEAAELVRLRLVSPQALADHPRRNVLTRTIGSQLLLRPDFRRLTVEEGDTFVLCTDGLWSEVSDAEIAAAAEQTSPDEAVKWLVGLQLGRASQDNATAQIVRVTAIEPVTAESEGWLTGIVGRLIGPRPGRGAGESP